MYRLVIVEDECEQAAATQHMLDCFPRRDELSVTLLTSAAAFEAFLAETPAPDVDILLMDIELGASKDNGIDLVAKHFPAGCGTQVIYATGHIEFCTRVYQTEHVYFLTKPLNQADFDAAFTKALENLETLAKRPLRVRVNETTVLVPPHKIRYIESVLRKVRLFTGGEPIETYASISKLEQDLPDNFTRCHKSFLVNMDYIAELQKDAIRLRTGELVPISQRKRKEMRDEFFAYLRRSL